ncbi:MAG: FAD-dependent oxidoreductase [Collinsella aerofaciens]
MRATLIDGLDRAAKNFDAPITEQVEAVYAEHGVELALGQMVTEFRLNESGAGVTVVTAGEYDVDYAIMGAGFLPRTDLFEGQLETLPTAPSRPTSTCAHSGRHRGQLRHPCRRRLLHRVYNPTGTWRLHPLATNAVRQALLVAANIESHAEVHGHAGNQRRTALRPVPAASGLTQAGAEARGVNARSTTIVRTTVPIMLTTTPVTATSPGIPRPVACWAPTPCAATTQPGRKCHLHRHPGRVSPSISRQRRPVLPA